jgi:hypothetical protein
MTVEERRLRELCEVLLQRYLTARDDANCQIYDRARYERETRILAEEQRLWAGRIAGERRDPLIDQRASACDKAT